MKSPIYCEICNDIITEDNAIHDVMDTGKFTGVIKRLNNKVILFQITTGINEWNKGILCKHCIIDAIVDVSRQSYKPKVFDENTFPE